MPQDATAPAPEPSLAPLALAQADAHALDRTPSAVPFSTVEPLPNDPTPTSESSLPLRKLPSYMTQRRSSTPSIRPLTRSIPAAQGPSHPLTQMQPAYPKPKYDEDVRDKFTYGVTEALSYCVLDSIVKKGEVWDDTGIRHDDVPEGTYWVVSSPNVPWIVKVPFGIRSARAYANGSYGWDDRTRCTQFFTSKFEYFACIPRWSEELQDLWYTPTLVDCPWVPSVAVNKDIRALSPAIVDRLRTFRSKYVAEAYSNAGVTCVTWAS